MVFSKISFMVVFMFLNCVLELSPCLLLRRNMDQCSLDFCSFDNVLFWSSLFKAVVLILLLIIEAEIDLYHIRRSSSPPHKINALQRGIIGLYVLQSIPLFLIYLSLWWILFDLYLNYRRGIKNLFYTGSEAWTDLLLEKLRIHPLITKLIGLFFTGIIYITFPRIQDLFLRIFHTFS